MKAPTQTRTFRVEVSPFEKATHPDHWSLFANYPSEYEAYDAVTRALLGYPLVRLVVVQTFERAA